MNQERNLSDALWERISVFLSECQGIYVGKEEDCRRFLNGCLWMLRTGAPWRDLPERYGLFNSVYKRWGRWSDMGGFTTKIHINVDALGNPLRFILTGGQKHDSTQAAALIEGFSSDYVMADKSYDSNEFIQLIIDSNAQPVIPPRSNRTETREYDTHLYRERHLVECFINKIKHFRRIFSRFEKLDQRYLSFLHFAGALVWMR